VTALLRAALPWLGWLWLGQQGMQFAGVWSVAPLALWWAVRLAGSAHQVLAPSSPRLLGATALAIAVQQLIGPAGGPAPLLICAVAWGLCCARLDAAAPGATSSQLGQLAMGLMMGTLWIGRDWCSAAGLPADAVLGLHLLLMVGVPRLLSPALRQSSFAQREGFALALLGLAGALALAGVAWGAMVGMVAGGALLRDGVSLRPALPLRWIGPPLLLAVGTCSAWLGPQALALAFGLIGVLALVALALNRISSPRRVPGLS
jgi:hypothetical protein